MDFEAKEGLFRFEWQVARNGYHLVQGVGGIRVIKAKSGPVHGYRFGKEHEGLHRRFASLVREPEAVLEFANEFGLLWQPYGELEPYEEGWLRSIGETKAVVAAIDEKRFDAVWDIFNNGRIKPRFSAYIDPDESVPWRSRFKFVPESLMAAMWLQVADESTTGTKFKMCEWCTNWFPFGQGTGRKVTKRFCSDRCRVARNRWLKKEASQ